MKTKNTTNTTTSYLTKLFRLRTAPARWTGLLILGVGLLCLPASGATLSWSGGGGANANWNYNANWGYVGTPANGDTVIFPASQPNLVNTNNIVGLTLNQIRFVGAGGGYDIRGNAFTLTNGIVATNTTGANTIENSITLATATALIVVSNGVSLTLDGNLTGSVGVTKAGLGTMLYQCSGNNTYAGTTLVAGGTLQLNVGGSSAFGGSLVIGDGTGTGSPTVQHLQSTEIADTAPITINLTGTLNLNNWSEVIGTNLTLSGGSVALGSGSLTLTAPSTITVNGGAPSYITGTGSVQLGAGPCEVAVASSATLFVYPSVQGTAAITKTGPGTLYLYGANIYTGLTTISQGWLWAFNSLALGATNSGTVVSNGASLVLQGNIGITNEALTLNGPGVSSGWGALDVENGTNTWAGPITLNTNSTLDAWDSAAALHVVGAIGGAGGLELFGYGAHYFEGTTANTYGGITTVDGTATLFPNKPAIAWTTVPAALVINGTVRPLANYQIHFDSSVSINDGGLLDVNGYATYIGALNGTGGSSIALGGAYLDVDYGFSGTSTFGGLITGAGTVDKQYPSTLILTNNNTYTGLTKVTTGTLLVNGSQPQCPISVNTGAFLGGSGTVGAITLNGSTIATGSAQLQVTGDINVLASSSPAQITGAVRFSNGLRTITVDNGSASHNIYITASLADAGGGLQIVNGATPGAWLALQGSNSFTGPLTISGDLTVSAETPWALGAASGNTFVTNSGELFVYSTGITNETVTLADGTALTAQYNCTWAGPITLAGNATIKGFATTGIFDMQGAITGTGNLTLTSGGATNRFSGSLANTYAGTTTVSSGLLQLGKGYAIAAIPGPLVINGGQTVRLLNSFQIDSPSKTVNLAESSLLDLAGNNEWVGAITMKGSQITAGSGVLYLNGDILVNPSTVAQSVISGNASLYNGIHTITNFGHYFSPDLIFSANVGSGGSTNGLIKAGAGEVTLSGNNSFTGPVTINGGNLWAQTSTALGNTNVPATVNSGGSLFLDGTGLDFGLKPLVLNGAGYAWGALSCSGSCSWEGAVTLGSDSTIYPYIGSFLTVTGAINGAGGVIKAGPGTLTLSGSGANSFAGTTTVSNGTLVLNKTAGLAAVPGNLAINSSGTVRLAGNLQTVNTADVLINGGGLFDFSTYNTYLDTLRGQGTVNFGVGGWIYVGLNNGTSEFDGSFTGTGYASGWTVGKTGSGTFTIGGNSTYTAGIARVQLGKMIINGSQPLIPVTVDSSATLGGTGVVGLLAANGTIAPGNSPGILNSSNLIFSSSGNFTVELTGPTPGVGGYDQLNVTGTVALANATLTVVPTFTTPVAIGQQFTILNNDGADAISGTFNGIANGSLFTAGGYTFRINYTGGTGNDIVLTLWGVPGNTVTLNSVDRGWYDSTGLHSPVNNNYLVGEDNASTNLFRNWFVFNMPVFSGAIIHAELIVNSYYNSSPHGQETYLLRKVTTPVATLEAGGSGLVGIYNDLGTGAVYSARSVGTNESYQKAIIPLNVTFLNDATAASGSQMALGGSLATLDAIDNNNQYLFGYSPGGPADDVQLRLTFGTALVINSTNRGFYSNLGSHNAANPNYLAGNYSGNQYRDFFVFNLPALSSQLVDAELLVNDYNVVSPAGTENYQLYDVASSITVLTNTQTTATNVYADLGSGVGYGGRNIYGSENGMFSSLPLNGSFVAAALANSGGRIALGGALATFNSAPTNEFLFGGSSGAATDAQLWLGFLAAPASHPSFVGGTPVSLGNNQFQLSVAGTVGTTNEIQGSFDFNNWDFIRDLPMTGSTTPFLYTNNTAVPYRIFRAEQLQ